MTSESCMDDRCVYPEPHRHGFACSGCEECERTGEGMKDRRVKACQHCYRRVRLMPAEQPGAPDRPVDDRGEPECAPGLMHKIMPVVPRVG